MGDSNARRLGLNGAWSMAVGGMVGGGVFSVMGLVYKAAGPWAPLSFVIAGAAALLAGISYCELTTGAGKSGGAYEFMREAGRERLAGAVGWTLIAGYTLTVAVYAFVFGEYIAYVFGADQGWLPRALALASIAALAALNLRDTGKAALVEIVTVWGKLAVLVGLAAIGLARWAPERLSQGAPQAGWMAAAVGAATVFMAYEGWQLLAYDYDDMDRPKRTLWLAVIGSIAAVTALYVAIAAGAAMLVGAGTLIEKYEVALAEAGRAAAGTPGLVAVTIAAAFSAASAINATLFSTARLMRRLAGDGELPGALGRTNSEGQPAAAVTVLAGAAAVLALAGSLGDVVEAASSVFLLAFASAGAIAWTRGGRWRWLHGAGCVLSLCLLVILLVELALGKPLALAVIAGGAGTLYGGHAMLRRRA